MSIFDVIFILLFAWSVFMGIRHGFILQLVTLLALLLGIFLAFKFSGLVANWITDMGVGAELVSIISFAIIFIAVMLIARLVGHAVEKVVKLSLLGWLNRLLGAVFSVIKMAFIISIVLFVLNSLNKELRFMPQNQVQKSKLYKPLSNLAPSTFSYLDWDKLRASFEHAEEYIDKKVEGED